MRTLLWHGSERRRPPCPPRLTLLGRTSRNSTSLKTSIPPFWKNAPGKNFSPTSLTRLGRGCGRTGGPISESESAHRSGRSGNLSRRFARRPWRHGRRGLTCGKTPMPGNRYACPGSENSGDVCGQSTVPRPRRRCRAWRPLATRSRPLTWWLPGAMRPRAKPQGATTRPWRVAPGRPPTHRDAGGRFSAAPQKRLSGEQKPESSPPAN